MRKQGTIFLNSEQKIIYAEKRVNNFLNNDEQRIILCRMLEIIYVENSEQFYLMQKKDFMNAVSRFEYTVNMMGRVKILLMQKQILSIQINSIIVKFKHEKTFRFGIQIQKKRFHQVFYEKTMNDFLNSEHKIIYAKTRVNNFLNNVEQKIILCKMLEIGYAKNSEQFL